jgi:surfactin synthase thioesterase subunit
MIVPVLKADFQLVDDYQWQPGAGPVGVPLTILYGRDDPWTTAGGLTAWGRHTTKACRLREIPGGHFFHQDARETVWREIRAALADGMAITA